MRIVYFINAVRFLVFLTSILALACHVTQCLLLSLYQEKAQIPSWISAGHWQYLSWYIALSISTVSGAAVCVHACCCKKAHILRGDKFLGILNVLPLLTSLITDVFVGGPEPWTAGTVKFDRPHTSLFQSCTVLDSHTDSYYPLLYQRCVMSDGTWLLAAFACMFWILLACLAVWAKPAVKPSMVAVAPAKEPKWGRYIPEPPPSLRSSSLPIVPVPPPHLRHGSLHYNPYQPRSDVSFDSQTTSSFGKRASTQYYDTGPELPYHHNYSSNNYPQLSLLPMVPRMDKIELFDSMAATNAMTVEMPPPPPPHRQQDYFYSTSPPMLPLSTPSHISTTYNQGWDYDHSNNLSPLSPAPQAMLGPHNPSDTLTQSSFGYSSSSTTAAYNTSSSRDYYPIEHRYSSGSLMPDFSISPPVADERRRPSVVTVESLSLQKPQQYDVYRS
ncbi:hypothetical protein BJV82DRAFT_83156 [Fennellomyces sp. T-0311]|nr:hypothetical protein BJV82DRAFT_83156 [Fennellomyces sp. T-0311]